jgi:hypothetical protein
MREEGRKIAKQLGGLTIRSVALQDKSHVECRIREEEKRDIEAALT